MRQQLSRSPQSRLFQGPPRNSPIVDTRLHVGFGGTGFDKERNSPAGGLVQVDWPKSTWAASIGGQGQRLCVGYPGDYCGQPGADTGCQTGRPTERAAGNRLFEFSDQKKQVRFCRPDFEKLGWTLVRTGHCGGPPSSVHARAHASTHDAVIGKMLFRVNSTDSKLRPVPSARTAVSRKPPSLPTDSVP
jgi:hypothetical protein